MHQKQNNCGAIVLVISPSFTCKHVLTDLFWVITKVLLTILLNTPSISSTYHLNTYIMPNKRIHFLWYDFGMIFGMIFIIPTFVSHFWGVVRLRFLIFLFCLFDRFMISISVPKKRDIDIFIDSFPRIQNSSYQNFGSIFGKWKKSSDPKTNIGSGICITPSYGGR